MPCTVLETLTEVGASIYFFNGQTEVRIPVGIGHKSVFLEQCWGLEGDGLLKARPHTNVRYSNEQSGPFWILFTVQASYDVWHCASLSISCKYLLFFPSSKIFCLIKVSVIRIFEKAPYDVSDMLLCHPFFTARALHDAHLWKGGKDLQSMAPVLLVRITHFLWFFTDAEIAWIHFSNGKVEPETRQTGFHLKFLLMHLASLRALDQNVASVFSLEILPFPIHLLYLRRPHHSHNPNPPL